MGHKHLCIECPRVVGEGGEECDRDDDHDFALCDICRDEGKMTTLWDVLQKQAESDHNAKVLVERIKKGLPMQGGKPIPRPE